MRRHHDGISPTHVYCLCQLCHFCQKNNAANQSFDTFAPLLLKFEMPELEVKSSEASSGNPYSMTEETLEKRVNKTQYGRISTQLYAAFIGWLSSITFGTALGWSGPVTYYKQTESEAPTTKNFALLVGMLPLGCSIGITYCSLLMKQFGPRKALLINGPFYTLTWWLMLIQNVNLQLAGRFFLGFLGMVYLICSENLLIQTIHYTIRQHISIFTQSSMLTGVLISKIVGYATSSFFLTVFCASIPLLHFCLLLTIPESPVYLYATSHQAAAKSLAWYRGQGNFSEDMAHIKKDWDAARQDPDAYRYMLFSKVVYKGLLIVIGVIFFQVCSGYFIFMFFSIYVWTNGTMITTETIDTTVIAALFVVSKVIWGALHNIYTFKMKKLLLTSCFLTSIHLSILAVHLLLNLKSIILVPWFPLVCMAFYLIFLDMGLNYYSKVLLYEYMPFQVLRRAESIAQSLFWLFNFFLVFGFARLRLDLPSYITFFGLAFLSLVGGFFVYFFVIDPKGKSLVQVQLELGGNPIGKRGALYNRTKVII